MIDLKKILFSIVIFLSLTSFVFSKVEDDTALYGTFIENFLYDYSQNKKSEDSYAKLLKEFPDKKEIKKDYFLNKIRKIENRKKNFKELFVSGKQFLEDEGFANDFEVLISMAYICINLEMYEDAKKYLAVCLKSDNAIYNKNVYFLSGLVDFQLGNYAKALANFKECYYIEPLDKEVIMFIAETNFKLGNFEESIEFLTRLKDKKNETYYYIVWLIANSFEKVDIKNAEKYYNEILSLKCPIFLKNQVYYKLGYLEFENNEFEKAEYFFKKCLERKIYTDLEISSYKKLCEIVIYKKDYKTAIFYKTKFMDMEYTSDLQSNTTKKTNYINDNLQLSWLYDKLGDDKKSLDILEKLAKNYSDNEKVNLYLGLKYYCLRNIDKAIFYVGKAENLAAAENKIFYLELINKIVANQKKIEPQQHVILSKEKDLKNDINDDNTACEKLLNYLKILKITDFFAKAKLKFSIDGFKNKVLIGIFYSNVRDGKLDIYLENGFCVGSFDIRNKLIFAEENKEKFFDISDKQNILQKFFEIFDFDIDINSQKDNLELKETMKAGYIFVFGSYKFLVDKQGNLKSITTDDIEIKFTKSINNFNLPTTVFFKNTKDYLKFKFLDFQFIGEDKQKLDEEIGKLNENKNKS